MTFRPTAVYVKRLLLRHADDASLDFHSAPAPNYRAKHVAVIQLGGPAHEDLGAVFFPSFFSIASKNGYRYYTDKELERLQQIMFYRELDFSLGQIKIALENEPNRLICLEQQRILLIERKERLTKILDTLDETISHAQKGAAMSAEKMFSGFDKEEWAEALQEQNDHLQKEYGYSIPSHEIDVAAMNEKAEEATRFMAFMARSLREGVAAHADIVQAAIREHIVFLQRDTEIDAASFAAQSHFFLSDDFHRSMMESQQVGLSYYVCIAADHFTTTEK